jgi:hypothetical protein
MFVVESGSLSHLRRAALLLVGPGPVKQRLCEATVRHLLDVNPAELPTELAASYRELMTSLRSTQAIGGMGPVEATVRKMSDQEAAACAARVLDLYVGLSGARPGRDTREHVAGSPRQLRLVGDD